jgi:hypothetical protein
MSGRLWYILAHQQGEKNQKAKLTWELVDQIRSEGWTPSKKKGGVTLRSLSEKYRLDHTTLYDVLTRESWQEQFRPR